MSKPKILIQLDADRQPSVFDAIVAADSGVDRLFRHGGVLPADVPGLVHGAMFTRGPAALKNTAVFIGGSDVAAGEQLLAEATKCFFGPMRVSVMLDSNGANTTAAAAVLALKKHLELMDKTVLVLGSTGPVGRRVVRLLATQGTAVRAASRSEVRSREVCEEIARLVPGANVRPHGFLEPDSILAALEGVEAIVSAGAAGATLLTESQRIGCETLFVAVDLCAVPPPGIEGIDARDKAVERHGAICYGALGIGGLKMKIHKACIDRLFATNDAVLNAEEIFVLARSLTQ